MKKILLMTMMAAAGAVAWGEGETPASASVGVEISAANVVGIQVVPGSSKNDVDVAVPFTGIGGGATTLASCLYTDNLTMASTVSARVNNPQARYSNWIWITTADYSGIFPSEFNGVTPSEAVDQLIPYGFGLKVHRNTASKPVYVMGEYSAQAQAVTLSAGTSSFLVNPLSTAIDVNAIFSKVKGVQAGDQIIVRRSGADTVYEYDEAGNGNGRYWKSWRSSYEVVMGEVMEVTTPVFTLLKISAGEGFWYFRQGSTDLSVTLQ